MSITASNFSPFFNSLVHALVALLVYAVPLLLVQHAQFGDMTVSSLVLLGLKYLDETLGK